MIFAAGFVVFVGGLAFMMQSPMIGGMIALGGWGILQLADDNSVDRFIGTIMFFGLVGMILAIFYGTLSAPH